MSVGCGATAEMVTPHHTGKSTPFAYANHIHIFFTGEDLYQHFGPDFQTVGGLTFGALFSRLLRRGGCSGGLIIFHRYFANELYRRQIVLPEMALHRLRYVLAFHKFHKTDLRSFVTVFIGALDLRNDAGTRLQYRDRMHVALIVKDLGHTDLLSQDSVNHSSLLLIIPAHFSSSAGTVGFSSPAFGLYSSKKKAESQELTA